MWLICIGSKRSGSTLQYNIVSKVVELSNIGIRIPFHKAEDFDLLKEKYKSEDRFKVIKTHQHGAALRQLVQDDDAIYFHCYRDIRDVVVSYFNKGWASRADGSIKSIVNDYLDNYQEINQLFENGSNFHSRKYEDFVFNIKDEANYIASKLDIKLSDVQLSEIESELSIEKLKEEQGHISNKVNVHNQVFDNKTLLHENHINNGSAQQFKNALKGSEIIAIEAIAWKWLITHKYNLCFPGTDLFLSLSQHADDYIAWQLLGKKTNGTVIEIGAFDGAHLSNSFSLAKMGWKSICIEPNPEIFDYLLKHRPESLNVNAAIVSSDQIKSIDFYIEKTGVLSGCDYDEEDVKRRHINRGLDYVPPRRVQVAAKTMNQVFNDFKIQKDEIDIVSIDVEGFELEVLGGLDIQKYKPKLFIIEANDLIQKEKILDFFEDFKDYLHIGDNHQNMFIVRTDAIRKKTLRKLDFENYIKAEQYHPVDVTLVIGSVKPLFRFTKGGKKLQRRFKLF